MQTNDKVLAAYQRVAYAVTQHIQSYMHDEALPAEFMLHPLKELAALYGINTDAYIQEIKERNDIPGQAQSLAGDDLVFVRIAGTLSQNLADISSCVYDVEVSLQMAEIIGRFIGTALLIKEFENA